MTTAPRHPLPQARSAGGPTPPSRFREGEARNRRLGARLARIAGAAEPDEQLMHRIGRAMREGDAAAEVVVAAMRLPADHPQRVRRTHLAWLADPALPRPDELPDALASLIAEHEQDPLWLDRELLAEGAGVYRRWGMNAADALLQLSLLGGYRFGGPTDLLAATGGLSGASTRRRLGETQRWAVMLSQPRALEPGRGAWRTTLHVRLIHALVADRTMRESWDVERWGRPINQADQAATLGLFDGVPLLGVRALGVPVTSEESRAVMHLWRYVGWLMGVHPDFLVQTERERHRLNWHLLIAQALPTPACGELARAAVDVQRDLDLVRPGAPALVVRARGRLERERQLSMLTTFLGPASMRELGLPLRPPWAIATRLAANSARYRLLGRGEAGRRRLESFGQRTERRVMRAYFGDAAPEIGALPG